MTINYGSPLVSQISNIETRFQIYKYVRDFYPIELANKRSTRIRIKIIREDT